MSIDSEFLKSEQILLSPTIVTIALYYYNSIVILTCVYYKVERFSNVINAENARQIYAKRLQVLK